MRRLTGSLLLGFMFLLVGGAGMVKAGELHDAVQTGDAAKVKALLEQGADANAETGNVMTPLQVAAAINNTEIAELLIDHGARVNAKDRYGRTPLHIAAEKNAKNAAELLIARGASVNVKDRYGDRTPLHIAAEQNAKEVAELLLAKGAFINARDYHGSTPLNAAKNSRAAIKNENAELISFLIAQGAKSGKK